MENEKELTVSESEKALIDELTQYLLVKVEKEKKKKKVIKKEAALVVVTGRQYRYAYLRRFISVERERLADMSRRLDELDALIKASNESSP